ncbi:hypothetical protein BH24PSE2_BH24PSE2_12570 [soil metagenome]
MKSSRTADSVGQASSATALKQRLAGLSPEQLAVLQKRLQQQDRSAYAAIYRLPDADAYPLSLHQRRLWFIEQFQPGTPLYNVTRAMRIRGPLDREALTRALRSLIARHEVLRTTFHVLDGEPVQRIHNAPEFELPLVHIESSLQERLTAEGRRVFDLAADLMLRGVLYRLAGDEHVLQVTIHHLACDGWSLQLLFDELSKLYRGFCSGQAAELPLVRHRYVDFARWQREPRQMKRFAERTRWWRDQLAGAPPILELPIDRPRPRIASGSGAIQRFEIPSKLREQLERLAKEEDATLYMALLAGFVTLLYRYTGMEDFLVGSATAGRHRPETHGIIGFFVDTIVLRADFTGNPTAREVLRRLRTTVIDAVEHSDVPFERVVESLDVLRELGRRPLFQVLFNVPPQYSVELYNLDVSPINVDLQISRFDLDMTYADGANRTTGITWNTDLFDAEMIRRMAGHYCVLLAAMAEYPDRSAHDLPLLTSAERHQLLGEWNDTAVAWPRDKCVHQIFQQQAEREPDAVAVVFEGQELTYREVNQRANELANDLRRMGVGAETAVGLCLEPSPELAIGILGILKAGGAYVPLDANYPMRRLERMIAEARIDFIVAQRWLLPRLSATDCKVICIDTHMVDARRTSTSNPELNVNANSLACVLFTSGSSGRPKAVAIRHFSIMRLVFGNDYVAFGSDRVFLQLATVSFDASTFELWGALLHGAKLVISPTGLPDFRQLEDLLKRNRVTTLWLTATLFNQVVEQHPQALYGVEEILTGGEVLSVPHVCKAQAVLDNRPQFINGYGPTESTTFTTCYRIPPDLSPETRSIPIGRPIGNTRVYVLDPRQQPVPIGIPGELYIGGAGLASGYLNQPELTAEKFVTNLFSDDPDSRLYRTGDLCRWRADGNLEFLQRIDHQVKLRGFRIEPGEIESILSAHVSVAQSVVLLREDSPGDKRLVAYCVAAADTTMNVSTLKKYLREQIPDYMMPAAFVYLKTLPLTPAGKIDRRGLPAPDDSSLESESSYTAPGTPVEKRVAGIWCDLLGLSRIGIFDDFFDVGGHSLLATQLASRIRDAFGVEVSIRDIFEGPTVSCLSALIAGRSAADGSKW